MFNKEEVRKMLMAGVVIGLSLVAYHVLDNLIAVMDFAKMLFRIMSPITVAFVIFYIINIPMKSVERRFFKKGKLPAKVKRALSFLITLLFFGGFMTVFIVFVIPQLADSIDQLIDQIPGYAKVVGDFLEKQFVRLNLSKEIIAEAEAMWTNFLGTFASIMLGLVNSTGSFVSRFISGIFTAILSSVLAIYMLLGREHLTSIFSRLWQAYSPQKITKPTLKYLDIVNDAFEHFIRGQLMEALILGIICYIGMLIFGFEYALLISFLVGITNIIPLFGPYIGAIPSVLLLLMVNPIHALWFILYVAVLQQLESNLIYPRVVGSSMGISGFWIMIAVIVGNSLFGIVGILMGIPLLSSLYIIVKEATEKRLSDEYEV